MLNPAMDCRQLITFLLIFFVPLISASCKFEEATICLNKVQILYDQFRTDILNETYIPKPSAKARICGNMEKGSSEYNCFYESLENCNQSVKDSFQREWNTLKEEHDQKCTGVCHLCSILLLVLLTWFAVFLPQ